MVKQNNNYMLLALVLVIGLIAGLIGGFVSSNINMTGNAIIKNNAAGKGTYLIRAEGTYVDTWLPWKDGSVYLTSNGNKDGGFIFRKWNNGSGANYTQLAKIDSNGNLVANNVYVGNLVTYQGVLSMLGSCEIIPAKPGLTNCIQTCNNKSKSCILVSLKDSYDLPPSGDSVDKYTDSSVVSCSANAMVGSHVGSDWTYESLNCVCCNPNLVTLNFGIDKTLQACGKSYQIKLNNFDNTNGLSAIFLVNGETTNYLKVNEIYTLVDGNSITLVNAILQAYVGGTQEATIAINCA